MISGTSDLIAAVFNKVDSLGLSVVQATYAALGTLLSPIFWTALTIYIAFWGLELMFGRSALTAEQIFTRVVRFMLIYALAFRWSDFQTIVVSTLSQATDIVGQAVCQAASQVGGTSGTAGTNCSASQSLSNVFAVGMNAGIAIASKGGWTAIGAYVVAAFIWIATFAFTIVSVGVILVGKVGLLVLLGLGPFFIALALFEFSSFLAKGWATQCVGFMVLQIFMFGVLGFEVTLMSTVTSDMTASINNSSGSVGATLTLIAPFVLMMGVGFFLTKEAIVIAASISGGARVSHFLRPPLGRWAGAAARGTPATGAAAGRGVAAAYRYVTGRGGNSMSSGANTMSAGEAQVRSALERNRQS
ncbi:type IV secretion system protein VirB6 [Rhizobiales bacterium GAS113]|nr:type IV secretion system protein VirB6 [Rhizobiales bacterium GAS113]